MTDCESLSPKAREIFEKLRPLFPLGPFKQPMWNEEGTVHDNVLYDLRKGVDRNRLMEKMQSTLGFFIKTTAGSYQDKHGSLDGFEGHPVGQMIKEKVSLLLILIELDFQIETMDFVEC